jgi:hypothetical protein
LGPVRISCHWPKDGKEKGQFTTKERKRQPHQRTHLSQRKKVRIAFAFAFAFAFCSTPFFLMVKGIKLKEKSKRKKKRSPDPIHYWPDTDSGLAQPPPTRRLPSFSIAFC